MANSNNSVITGKLRGSLGKQLVFREWDGKTIVSKAPGRRKGRRSASQLLMQDKFKMASQYARAICNGEDEGIKEAYSLALNPRQNLYSRALADFMSSPVVKDIDCSAYSGQIGTVIAIRAVDDFRVVTVHVEIYAATGMLLEKGSAAQETNGIIWTYTSTILLERTAGGIVKVTARDVPGNQGMLQITL